MSDSNTPTTIPCELNVPSDNGDNGNKMESKTIELPLSSKTCKSADKQKSQLPRHRLRADGKSQSMFNFSTTVQTTSDEPPITLSATTATYHHRPQRASSGSLSPDRIETENSIEKSRKISASTNEIKLSANRRRINSISSSSIDQDEIEDHAGPQLRIRSSIISLFARMGKLRRTSNISISENDNSNVPPLLALPQIAAAKILRAFSYVGKSFYQ